MEADFFEGFGEYVFAGHGVRGGRLGRNGGRSAFYGSTMVFEEARTSMRCMSTSRHFHAVIQYGDNGS